MYRALRTQVSKHGDISIRINFSSFSIENSSLVISIATYHPRINRPEVTRDASFFLSRLTQSGRRSPNFFHTWYSRKRSLPPSCLPSNSLSSIFLVNFLLRPLVSKLTNRQTRLTHPTPGYFSSVPSSPLLRTRLDV